MTQGMKLFSFYTSLNFIRQKFFIFFCKKSCIQKYNLHSCSFLSNKWSKPPIRYPYNPYFEIFKAEKYGGYEMKIKKIFQTGQVMRSLSATLSAKGGQCYEK